MGVILPAESGRGKGNLAARKTKRAGDPNQIRIAGPFASPNDDYPADSTSANSARRWLRSGCRSFSRPRASIWRMRSRVMP